MMRLHGALSGLPPFGLPERDRVEHDAMLRKMRPPHHGEREASSRQWHRPVMPRRLTKGRGASPRRRFVVRASCLWQRARAARIWTVGLPSCVRWPRSDSRASVKRATGLVELDLVSRSEDWAFALLFNVGPGSPVSVDPGRQFDVGRNERHDLVRLTGLAKDDLAKLLVRSHESGIPEPGRAGQVER